MSRWEMLGWFCSFALLVPAAMLASWGLAWLGGLCMAQRKRERDWACQDEPWGLRCRCRSQARDRSREKVMRIILLTVFMLLSTVAVGVQPAALPGDNAVAAVIANDATPAQPADRLGVGERWALVGIAAVAAFVVAYLITALLGAILPHQAQRPAPRSPAEVGGWPSSRRA